MQNPYHNKLMLPPDSDMFFGREREMRVIEGLLNSGQPQSVAIVGERRIGKSSLANRVFHKMKAANNTLAIFLDCDELSENCNSKDQFFKILNEQCRKERPGIQADFFQCYSSFKCFIANEKKNGLWFVIFLDEFEHLPEKEFADNLFFSNLRSMANHPDNRLAFVTISQKSLKELTHNEAIKTSEFWNIFTAEIIGTLDDKSIAKLRVSGFKKNNLLLDDKELTTIEHYAGNFPFFNQIVCKHIFDEKAGCRALNKYKLESELREYYETLWQYRSEREQAILKRLKKPNHVGNDDEMMNLVNRGILKRVNQNEYRLFSGFFSEFIKKQGKSDSGIVSHNISKCMFAVSAGIVAGLIVGFIIGFSSGVGMSIGTGIVANMMYNKYFQ